MERRTKLGLLILIALIILAFGIWYLLQPIFKTVPQPPDLGNQIPSSGTIPTSTGGVPVIDTGGGAASVSNDVKQLQNLAGVVVARLGSGANGEGFQGYNDVMINATPAYRSTLASEQQALRAAHPPIGEAYGVVTRTVSTDIVSAVSGANEMTFSVQAQKAEDAGNPGSPTRVSYVEATVTFQRQSDGGYLLSNVVWKDIQL